MRRKNRRKLSSRTKSSRKKAPARRRPRAKLRSRLRSMVKTTGRSPVEARLKATPAIINPPPRNFTDLPFSYGETKLVLMVRDPYWAYSYWDFSGETWVWCQKKLAEDSSLKAIMRIQDLDAKRYY